jgi:hypothetical protein
MKRTTVPVEKTAPASTDAPQTPYATPAELARRWHKTESALAIQRCRGEGPSYVKLGRRVLYVWASIREIEERNTVGAA